MALVGRTSFVRCFSPPFDALAFAQSRRSSRRFSLHTQTANRTLCRRCVVHERREKCCVVLDGWWSQSRMFLSPLMVSMSDSEQPHVGRRWRRGRASLIQEPWIVSSTRAKQRRCCTSYSSSLSQQHINQIVHEGKLPPETCAVSFLFWRRSNIFKQLNGCSFSLGWNYYFLIYSFPARGLSCLHFSQRMERSTMWKVKGFFNRTSWKVRVPDCVFS